MPLEPYLSFEGRCEEAIAFYKVALGAEVLMSMRFNEAPDQSMCSPGAENKIMHATLRIAGSIVMASDGQCSGNANFGGISLSISVPTEAEVRRLADALANGGKTTLPPMKTFWSPCFGMVTDRFGVSWMLSVESNAGA